MGGGEGLSGLSGDGPVRVHVCLLCDEVQSCLLFTILLPVVATCAETCGFAIYPEGVFVQLRHARVPISLSPHCPSHLRGYHFRLGASDP